MDEDRTVRLISQFLYERGYQRTLEALQEESGREFKANQVAESGALQSILDEYSSRIKQKQSLATSVEHLKLKEPGSTIQFLFEQFAQGQGEYAHMLLKSLDDASGGVNILVVKLIENGVLIFGASKSLVGIGKFTLPLSCKESIITPIISTHTFCNGAVLALDVHPLKRNLVLCGSMDRQAFILDLSNPGNLLVQKFENHSKYVVRVLWSSSGKFFITASYDKTIVVYREQDINPGHYESVQRLSFKGAIESLAFAKDQDVFVVGVRNDYLLHCYDLSSGNAEISREINMNAFGDDYVSFAPMHLSFSPDGRFILISSDRDRLVMYSWDNGKQIANFYGASNDEYSQPRHCWDSSGKYIYGTSQDKSIVVWEIRTQSIVAKLEGHTATVRDLHFCNDLNILVSCGFDGSVKLWKNVATPAE